MTDQLTTYAASDGIATITMDDGKANAMSPAMLASIDAQLDRAEADGDVVVLRGRPGMFSAGFDLGVFKTGDMGLVGAMLHAGGALVHRLLTFPRPVVAACTGHAMAQGTFVLNACDVRIGLDGAFRFGMNEVVIGLTVPHYAVAVSRYRMPAAAFDRALGTGVLVGPQEARTWGLLDVVAEDEATLDALVAEEAQRLTTLDAAAYTGTKLRTRGAAAAAVREGLDGEFPAPG